MTATATTRDLDVLAFGEVLIDFFPPAPGIALGDAETFQRHLGGAPANVAVGLARLGLRVGLMTLVGSDEFGRFLRQRLRAEGVDVSALGTHPRGRTGITFVAVSADGERSFLGYRGNGQGASADLLMRPEDVDPAQIARARVVHFGSSSMAREPARSATLHAFACARAAGARVSFDPNWRPHLWDEPATARALVQQIVAGADVVKLSEEEIEPLLDTRDPVAAAARLRALGAGIAVVTLGPRGCYYDAASGRGWVPGVGAPIVDTTGAGDAFVAGLLAGLCPSLRRELATSAIDEATLRAACALANRVGAAAVTCLGATTGVPRARDLDGAGEPLPGAVTP